MLVSCIMPTANRRAFAPDAIRQFLEQDYGDRELIVVDDGDDPIADLIPQTEMIRYYRLSSRWSLGAKRNLACEQAHGDLIAHWDDDDWSAPGRLSYQVAELVRTQADVCGLAQLHFFDADSRRAWKYTYSGPRRDWVAGGTLLYRKSFWRSNPFPAVSVGEDARFLWNAPVLRLHALDDTSIFAARIHAGNTSPKRTGDGQWKAWPYEQLPFCHPAPSPAPLASCIMPTYNRRSFVSEAIRLFLDQDYPSRELVVVDDGSDCVADLMPPDPRIRYHRCARRETVGAKRNIAVQIATGEYIVHWDDDDWYAPDRLTRQLAPLHSGEADVTALPMRYVLELPAGDFFRCPPETHRKIHYKDLCCGTIAYHRRLWAAHGPYPALNCAEDVRFLMTLPGWARIHCLADEHLFVCVRHGGNTWPMTPDWKREPSGWQRVEPPSFYPHEDRG